MNRRGLMIIHNFRPGPTGGAELQAERLAKKLTGMGHSIQILTSLTIPEAPNEETCEGVKIHRVNFPLAYDVTNGVENTFRFLFKNRHSFDILHAHMAFGHAVAAVVFARSFGKKCIIKIACSGSFGDLSVFSNFDKFEWALEILHKADQIVAVSREVENELVMWGFPAERVVRIPNGVDVEYFRRSQPLPEWSKIRFILVGRRTHQKGIDTALHSIKRLVEQGLGNRLELKLYGLDFPEYDYKEMARNLDVMDWVEFLPQTNAEAVLDIYQKGHCLILPSRGEGLSNALLEAMAMEMPVIASEVSGTVDVVTDGQEGLLIPCDSEYSLSEAMKKIIENPDMAITLGQSARNKMLSEFSLDSVARKYSDLYNF